MKKKVLGKRTLSIVMTIIMITMTVVSLVGCGDEGKETSQSITTNENASTETGNGEVEERITLTMQAESFESTFAAGLQDDPVMNAIEDKLNINLNIIPENSIADINAKLSAQMASRDLPDIVAVKDSEIKKQMISSGLALDLTPYKEQLADVENNRPGSLDYFENMYSIDIDNEPVDGLYFVGFGGTQGNLYRPKVGFYVRWDLYEQLGYPEINSYDDYITLAQDMLELEPVNKDGKTNYGISAWFAQSGAFGPWAITTAFSWDGGYNIYAIDNVEVDYETSEITDALTNPGSQFWSNVQWWNKAYRAGIVDPNSFIQKWPEYLENIDSQNRAMIAFSDFAILGGETQFVTDGEPEKGYVALPSPLTDRSVRTLTNYFAAGNKMYMVSADCEYPEKAVELLNYLASWEGTMLIYNGVQGETWDIIDGVPQLFEETIAAMNEDPDYALKTGMNKYNNLGGMGEVDFWPEYDVPAKLMYMPAVLKDNVTEVEAGACEYYGVDYPGQIVTVDKDEVILGTDQQLIDYFALPDEAGEDSERRNEISAQLQDIYYTDIYEAILAESEEEFEEVKAQLIEKSIGVGGLELFEYELARFESCK